MIQKDTKYDGMFDEVIQSILSCPVDIAVATIYGSDVVEQASIIDYIARKTNTIPYYTTEGFGAVDVHFHKNKKYPRSLFHGENYNILDNMTESELISLSSTLYLMFGEEGE